MHPANTSPGPNADSAIMNAIHPVLGQKVLKLEIQKALDS